MKKEVKNLLDRLNEVKKTGDNKYMAKCCCHADDTASLSISVEGNRILINCFAGCKTEDIVNNLGLEMKDLFLGERKENKMTQIEAEYIYTKENGEKLYKVMRKNPKGFIQAKFENNEWKFKMTDVSYVPYNLPNVIKSDVIYFVEGEKDADNLNNLGLTATTTVGGASSFNKRAGYYCKYFKDKTVYILPDNDKSGYNYADNIKKALKGIAKNVKILKLKNEIKDLKYKGDISDVVAQYGKERTLEIIKKLINTDYKEEETFSSFVTRDLNAKNFSELLKFLGIEIKFDLITKKIIINGMPDKFSKSDLFSVLPIYLKDVLKNNGIKVTTSTIEEYILLEISQNNFNPFVEMLQNNVWDGKDRITEIYNILHLKNDFYKTLVKKWLYQTVSISLNSLDKPFGIEGVLTLQGKQGIGKTRFFSLLALKPEWFAEGVTIDVNNKDSLLKATSKLICELGEVDDTLKKQQSALKGFVTSAEDDIRPPYGKKSIRRARNTSFCATVNPQSFLKDETRE